MTITMERAATTALEPADWLEAFYEAGGYLTFDEAGKPSFGFWVEHNSDEGMARARDLLKSLTPDQTTAIVAERHRQAAHFQPLLWCIEFRHLGGWFAWNDGKPCTCYPEQADDRAIRFRGRLLPEEATRLGKYLRHHLPRPAEEA